LVEQTGGKSYDWRSQNLRHEFMSDSPNPEQEQEYQAQLAQQMRRYAENARSIINDNYEVVLTYNASGLQWIDK